MAIRLRCPACGARCRATDATAGRVARCGKCGRHLRVPVPPGGPPVRTARRLPPAVSVPVTAAVLVALVLTVIFAAHTRSRRPDGVDRAHAENHPADATAAHPESARPGRSAPPPPEPPRSDDEPKDVPPKSITAEPPAPTETPAPPMRNAAAVRAELGRAQATFVREIGEFRKAIAELLDKRLANARTDAEARRAAVETQTAKYRKAVADYFGKLEADAGRAGNKTLVEQAKQQRTSFAETGQLPDPAPAELTRMKEALAKASADANASRKRLDRFAKEAEVFHATGQLPRSLPPELRQPAEDAFAIRRAAYEAAVRVLTRARVNDLARAIETERAALGTCEDLEQPVFRKRPAVGVLDPECRTAVANGLAWLARKQLDDASWEFDGTSKDKIASTGMVLQAFLTAGEGPGLGTRYEKTVEKGLGWLMGRVGSGGGFAGTNSMYAHAIATVALCDAADLTGDEKIKAKAAAAVGYIVGAQGRNGSWGYTGSAPSEGDTSITGWQVEALASARLAEIKFDADKVFKKANAFLESVSSDSGSKYGYRAKGGTPTLSAVGLLSRHSMRHMDVHQPAFARGVDYLKQSPPTKASFEMYYYYYATRVVRRRGGDDWEKFWLPKMRAVLLGLQNKGQDESKRGSWDRDQGFIGSNCGRLGTTALAILTLQVCGKDPG